MKAQALPPSNLPVQLTSFVGREPELAELMHALRRSRLVTIAGASGLGKTRLAVELARRTRAEHPDGVWFASLAALSDPDLVPREVARTLGVREHVSGGVVRALRAHIGERELLLVLDNCEHLLDATARLIEDLLQSCSALRVLATGHEPLRLPGERVWRIPPLGLPDRDHGMASFETIAEAESIQLFRARAGLVQPQFALTPINVDTVARICERLDGIPLAIELAAARTEMMSVNDILARLEDRFRLLTGGSRTALPRHQTLRAALDWGHTLLNDDERKLFRRLSVFAGGFELTAAEAVGAGPDLPVETILGHLSGLVDKSLVVPVAGPGGRTRCRMLETVRQYAVERLAEAGEGEDAGRRHAEHLLGLAEQAAGFDRRPGQADWLERLEADHDDLRAALARCRAHDHARWVRMTLSLTWFWLVRGHLSEGREWLRGVLALPSLAAADRARTFYWLARMAFWQGDYDVAQERADAGLAAYRALDDRLGAGWTLNLLGSIHLYAGDVGRAIACLEEVLVSAADVALRVDTLITIGEARLVAGDVAGARGPLEQALAEASGPDGRWLVANGVLFLSIVDYFDREHRRARERLDEALDVFQQLGNRYALSGALYVAGALSLAEGAPERALRLCGAAMALRDTIRAPLPPGWQDMARSVVVEPARALVGAGRADAALADGMRMSVDEAVAEARTEPEGAGAGVTAGGDGWGPLSRREREVAVLVAQGMTNRQIADRLVIAERTVEGHLERIRGKLGLHTRTQIAVWVVGRR
ncbi:MAG TPA: LuxR C-terminal-related transcriptional regulator [Candidatus Dormibacteraeota bacterium]|nr:LuxR C-terminal-related transcriptional regulator [Candidatus Dormibacteraeota bacterium]